MLPLSLFACSAAKCCRIKISIHTLNDGRCTHRTVVIVEAGQVGRTLARAFQIQRNLHILNDAMMRAATVLIVLFSILSAPVASAVCSDCCGRFVEHRLPVCHDKAHAHLGPHAHHMNHMHMVTQDSDAYVVLQQCAYQLQDGRLRCHHATCLSANPVQLAGDSVPANQLAVSSHLIATTISSSLTMSGGLHPPGACPIAISSSHSASAPLRI